MTSRQQLAAGHWARKPTLDLYPPTTIMKLGHHSSTRTLYSENGAAPIPMPGIRVRGHRRQATFRRAMAGLRNQVLWHTILRGTENRRQLEE